MKILITGVAGLLGSRLADWIISNTDHQIIGVDNLSGGFVENINNKVIFCRLDLAHDDISQVFEKYRPDIVYHYNVRSHLGSSNQTPCV